jgi:hypothetical protein
LAFVDTLLENRIRRLGALERGMHVLLFINYGAYSALLIGRLAEWHAQSSGLEVVPYGMLAWLLSVLAFLALAWSMRDAVAFHRLGHLPKE